MKIKLFAITIILLNFTLSVHSQQEKFNPGIVYNTKRLVWYGIDMSHLKLVNARKILMAKQIYDDFFPAWVNRYLEKTSIAELQQGLKKNVIIDNSGDNYKRIKEMDADNWVVSHDYKMPEDTIQQIISDYNDNNNTGIGFIIIFEKFNKYKEHLTAYYVFFDIETKTILINDIVETNAYGSGMTDHWGDAMANSTDQYYPYFVHKSDEYYQSIRELGYLTTEDANYKLGDYIRIIHKGRMLSGFINEFTISGLEIKYDKENGKTVNKIVYFEDIEIISPNKKQE